MGGFYHEENKDSSLEISDMTEMDRGLAYGEACFETFRVINGEVFRWREHMQRLAAGLAGFGIVVSEEQVKEIQQHCLAKAATMGSDVLMRLTVSGGVAGWGLLQHAAEPAYYLQVMSMKSSRCKAKSLRLQNWPFPLRHKTAKFTADYAETLRALKGQVSTDVLFSCQNHVLAAATANVLLYREGQWWTPIGAGVLEGIVRGYLIEAGHVSVSACPVDWLEGCEAMVLSNCGSFLQPVDKVTGASQRWLFDPCHPAIKTLRKCLAGQAGVSVDLLP